MGTLVVHCPNRPADEVIDCGIYGFRLNMHSHNVDAVKNELVVGIPLDKSQKLPFVTGENDNSAARAQSAGAVVDTSVSGIPSTFIPGGIEPPPPVQPKPSAAAKSTKEGGE